MDVQRFDTMTVHGVESYYEECVVARDGSAIWREGVKYVPAKPPRPELPEFICVESRTGTSARAWCNNCDFGSMWVSPHEAFDWAYAHIEDEHPKI